MPGMQVKYNMVVDFARPNKSNTILVAENDANSRKCTFTLLFDKEPFDMSAVTTATILGITSTGARIYADATIEQDEEGNNINVIWWVIPAALTDTAGNITLTVTLADNVGGRITSFEFYVKVRNALYNEDDYIDEDDLEGFRDLLNRTRAALERMEQMVEQEALPNPYPIRISVDNVDYEYNGESLVEILMGEVAYLGPITGTVDITSDDSAAAQAARSAAQAATSAGSAEQAYTDTRLLIDNFQSQIPTATVTKNTATHQSVIVITDKNGTTTATVEDGVVGSSWYAGTDLIGKTTNITGYAGNAGDYYLNTASGNVYRCNTSGTIATALWDYVLTMGSNTFKTVKINSTNIVAEGDDILELIAGDNVTLVPNALDKSVTIHSAGGGGGGTSDGDMKKSVYDSNKDGIVNSADTLNGLTSSITELNLLSGATSNIQNQISGKAASVHTHVSADITDLSIPANLSDLSDDSTHRLVTDTEKTTWNGKQNALQAGTGITIDPLTDTISATASTQLGYKRVKVGNTDIDASQAEDTIEFEAGNGMTITPDAANKKITFISTGGGGTSTGDMLKIVYDQNNNGIVDKAETLNDGTTALAASISELNYVDGVTSSIQDQLDGKAATSHTHTKNQITDFPTIPTALTQLDCTGDTNRRVVTDAQITAWNQKQNALQAGAGITIAGNEISATGVQSDWDETDTTDPAYIQNKPTIPAEQIQSDWNQSDTTAKDFIKNKPSVLGHTMLPTPSESVDESAIVGAVNTALVEGGTNDDVGSLNTIGTWSNTFEKSIIVKKGTALTSPIGTTGIGTWDDATMSDWIQIADLKGISAKEHHIDVIHNPKSFSGVQPILRGYQIEDYIEDDTKNYGLLCIKFANEIDPADCDTAEVGIKITISRTPISYITP